MSAMIIEQKIDIPESREVRFTLPKTVPIGQAYITLTFASKITVEEQRVNPLHGRGKDSHPALERFTQMKKDPSLESVLMSAHAKFAERKAHPEEFEARMDKIFANRPHFGRVDAVEYQRTVRDEWEDRLAEMGLSQSADV